jgi:hypothetical protein
MIGTTITRNELGPAHANAEELFRQAMGLSVTLDMRSRRPWVDLEPATIRALQGDLAAIDATVAALHAALDPHLVEV